MQHAAAHGNQQLGHLLEDAHVLESTDTPLGQGQVDGTAGRDGVMPHVRLAFVHRYLEAASGEKNGQQAASETGADQCNVFFSLHLELMSLMALLSSCCVQAGVLS